MKNLDIHKKMRDPAGNIKRYETEVGYILERDLLITTHVPESLDQEIWFKIQTIGTTLELIIHKYGVGDPIEAIRALVLARSDLIAENSEFVRVNGAAEHSDFSAVDGIRRVDVAFTAIALLLVELPHYLDVFRRLLSTKLEGRSYVMDLLIKSFIPDHKLLNKYQSDRHARAWMEPFLRALATDPDRRSADLATYMNNWCRTMRHGGGSLILIRDWGKIVSSVTLHSRWR